MAEFSYEIVEQIGVLSQNTNGWSRQINKISWNGRDPKFDIRDWAPTTKRWEKVFPSPWKSSRFSKTS